MHFLLHDLQIENIFTLWAICLDAKFLFFFFLHGKILFFTYLVKFYFFFPTRLIHKFSILDKFSKEFSLDLYMNQPILGNIRYLWKNACVNKKDGGWNSDNQNNWRRYGYHSQKVSQQLKIRYFYYHILMNLRLQQYPFANKCFQVRNYT